MSNTSANGIFTFPLALSPSEKLSLYCSFHDNIRNPNELFKQMYNAAETSLALLDATKIVSINQLLTAANLAATRKIEIPSAWDLVHLVAPSNHAGHILRDFSFSEPAIVEANVLVVWIARSGNEEEYCDLLETYRIPTSTKAIDSFLAKQAETNQEKFINLYKLTNKEVAFSSLEAAVITRIATKMHV
jgi:Kinase binding protein CGI-121